MANPEHLKILKRGVEEWNSWREARPEIRPDLSEADLSEANLSEARLNGADLSRANLTFTIFRNTELEGASLEHAHLGRTVLSDLDLSLVKNLDSCEHWSASGIDHQTLQKSRDLPLVFLRGCGLSDEMIEYLPSLTGATIQFYSCFISYSSDDEECAKRLHADLQDAGVRCWFAPHDIQGGKKVNEQLHEAIRVHDRMLLILSESSMNSEWVETEIANARQREQDQDKRVLFPVRLVDFELIRQWKCFDADTGKDSAREIREYFIPDFSNWKNDDAYQKAFERLLRDLKQKPGETVES